MAVHLVAEAVECWWGGRADAWDSLLRDVLLRKHHDHSAYLRKQVMCVDFAS